MHVQLNEYHDKPATLPLGVARYLASGGTISLVHECMHGKLAATPCSLHNAPSYLRSPPAKFEQDQRMHDHCTHWHLDVSKRAWVGSGGTRNWAIEIRCRCVADFVVTLCHWNVVPTQDGSHRPVTQSHLTSCLAKSANLFPELRRGGE